MKASNVRNLEDVSSGRFLTVLTPATNQILLKKRFTVDAYGRVVLYLYARKRRHQASTSIGVLREVPLHSGLLEKNP